MSLKDKIVRKLALRWARGKVKDLRGKDRETTMGKVLKALDGWKLLLGVLALFAVQVYDQTQNGHAGDIVGAVLTVLGWMPAGFDLTLLPHAAASAVAVWGFIHKLVKAQKQVRAGSSVAGALGTEGYVAIADEELAGAWDGSRGGRGRSR